VKSCGQKHGISLFCELSASFISINPNQLEYKAISVEPILRVTTIMARESEADINP